MPDFTDRVALVTGAASGLGKAIATEFAMSGASVALLDLDEASLTTTVDELRERTSATLLGIQADISSVSDVERAIKTCESELGPIDVLVNNAGIAVIKTYLEHTDEDFDRQFDVNLRGTHLMMRRVLPGMVERGTGAVVNISSAAAAAYTTPHAGYAASKAAVIALTRDVGFEVARYGVRVNCVLPGLIAVPPSATKTPFLQTQSAQGDRPPITARTTTRPLGYGRPEDIADAVAFLASDKARFIVGTTLHVTGGTDLKVTMGDPGVEFDDAG